MCYFAPFLQGGGILSSCNKNQEPIKETFSIEANYENLNQEIARFKTSMLDTRKSATVIELNEAIWMMEATFNYYHGFTGEDYLETYTDSTFIPITYGGFDEVPLDELQQIYKQVNNALVASFENYPAQNKKPFIYDLELQGTTSGTQLLVMTTVGTVNTQKNVVIGTETPFGSTDYWKPGYGYGKCGSYIGTFLGRDASTELISKLKRKYFPSYPFHYVDIETNYQTILPYMYPYPQNPYDGPYLLLQGHPVCMEPDRMNFYFNGTVYVVNNKKPAAKTFADCKIKMQFNGDTMYEDLRWTQVISNLQYGVQIENVADHQPGLPTGL